MAKIAYRLKHRWMTGDFIEYFYDAELHVKDGVIEIPDNKKHLLGAAWVSDFQLNPETGKMYGGLEMVPYLPDAQRADNLAKARAAKAAKKAEAEEPQKPESKADETPSDEADEANEADEVSDAGDEGSEEA